MLLSLALFKSLSALISWPGHISFTGSVFLWHWFQGQGGLLWLTLLPHTTWPGKTENPQIHPYSKNINSGELLLKSHCVSWAQHSHPRVLKTQKTAAFYFVLNYYYFICMGILPACTSVHHMCTVPKEPRRGCQFLWNCSCRHLGATRALNY